MATNNKKLTFSDFLSYLGMAACVLFLFKGMIYVLHGNVVLCSFICAAVLLVLLFFPTQLVKFKQKSQKEPNHAPEISLSIVYAVLAFAMFPFIFHSVDVEYTRKDEIKKAGLDKVAAIQELRTNYTLAVRNEANKNKVAALTEMNNYLTAFQPAKEGYKRQIERRFPGAVNFTANDMYIASRIKVLASRDSATISDKLTLDSLDKEFDEYQQKATSTFENWRLLTIGYYYDGCDSMYKKYYAVALTKLPSFSFTKSYDKGRRFDNPFESLRDASMMILLLVIFLNLLVHACILAPYLIAGRYHQRLKRNTSDYAPPPGAVKNL
ncbi:MAG: hypothetical protein JST68_27200 [Bacteroidetes bacterium]|nr:hypothetical protein [Bacteroidota bacterium]